MREPHRVVASRVHKARAGVSVAGASSPIHSQCLIARRSSQRHTKRNFPPRNLKQTPGTRRRCNTRPCQDNPGISILCNSSKSLLCACLGLPSLKWSRAKTMIKEMSLWAANGQWPLRTQADADSAKRQEKCTLPRKISLKLL